MAKWRTYNDEAFILAGLWRRIKTSTQTWKRNQLIAEAIGMLMA